MALLGPFSVGYPVAFKTGGDTTREAFGKHIQEIERIYGILNALDNGKVSADDLNNSFGSINNRLQQHIDSTNPHPNWKIKFSDLIGDLDGSRLTGKIDASLIYGLLNNANIDANRVYGLEAFIRSLLPDDIDGITDKKLEDNGYVKFSNGLIIQWGYYEYALSELSNPGPQTYATANFPTSFSSKCFLLITGTRSSFETSRTGFTGTSTGSTVRVDYLAIGV